MYGSSSEVSAGRNHFFPFKAGGFRTPSGKAELYSESLKREGLDPVVEFVPPQESRHNPSRQGVSSRTLGP